jgi:hypothetical protein
MLTRSVCALSVRGVELLLIPQLRSSMASDEGR